MNKIYRCCLIMLFLFQWNLVLPQISSKQIDSIAEQAMSTFPVAGMAIAVVKDGKIIHQKGYGEKSIGGNDKVTEHTNFGIASNSKAFTTAALAILVEQGKLNWTDKVIDHLPEFRMYNDYVTENFNIKDLLTHRSGLGLGIGDLMFFPDGADFGINDIVNSFQYFKPESAFRTKFDYDNLLYLVAGEVIQRVSGQPWEEFIKQNIFEPLEMDNSYASLTFINEESIKAQPHTNVGKKITKVKPEIWDPEKINGAAAGIYSNVNDLANWMMLQLNKGKYGESLDKKLFTEENQQEMWTIHTPLTPDRSGRYNSHFRGYGLGWDLTDMKGNLVVSHTGGLIGMLSKTILVPDLNLGIVVLTNTYPSGGGVFSAVSQTILDKFLGVPESDWIGAYRNRMVSQDESADKIVDQIWETSFNADKSKLKVNDYVGIYEDPWFGKVEISLKGKDLWFQSKRSPKIGGKMYYYNANTFIAKWEDPSLIDADAFVMFQLDETGKAQAIKMKGISPKIDFSYDFHDLELKRIED